MKLKQFTRGFFLTNVNYAKIKNEGMLNTFLIHFHSVDIVYFLPLRLDPYRVEAKNVSVEGPDTCTLGASSGTSTSSTIYKHTFFNLKKKINISNLPLMCSACEEHAYQNLTIYYKNVYDFKFISILYNMYNYTNQ